MGRNRKIELEEFVDEIYTDSISNPDSLYVFFLGAGCSKNSGIQLASELAENWYQKLKKQSVKFNKFLEKEELVNKKESKINFGALYFSIFEELFPSPFDQQKEIQKITENKTPSSGYYVLSELMQRPSFNTVITTNFDNLIQDALIYSGNKRALVITHQDLAQFIKRDGTPLITKIHGDAHMHPFNNSDDTKSVPEPLGSAIQNIIENAKIIFIGYKGNDESIANLLTGCKRIDQVYWFGTNEPDVSALGSWWNDLKFRTHVLERDFDRIMSLLKNKFNLKEPDFKKRVQTLEESYLQALKHDIDDLNSRGDKTFVDYSLLGSTYSSSKNFINAIESYKKAVKLNPNDENAYFGLGFAYGEISDFENAKKAYEKVLYLNPQNDSAYYNLGCDYSSQNNYKEAIESYKKAIEISPNNISAYESMGVAYGRLKQFKKAIELYKKAIEIDPMKNTSYTNIFEAQIIEGIEFDTSLEKEYLKLFKNNPNILIKYDMLKIISDISKNLDASSKLDKWLEDYKELKLDTWSFSELEDWANTKSTKMKQKLLEVIEQFKKRMSSSNEH